MPKVFFVSLGCAKNLVDSELMLGLITGSGYEVTNHPSDAEIAIVNTCAFIRPAIEESIETILELARLRQEGRLRRLLVAGCFVQRYGRKLIREIPEVDGWLGTGQIHRVLELLEPIKGNTPLMFIDRPLFLADHSFPRAQTTPFYSSYLKIAEGCSHRCSYCIIPALRGPYRSRTLESLFIEAKAMVEHGVIELNLVAQDTTSYGHDLDPPHSIEELLEGLLGIRGLRWLRILYAHPHFITDRLLDLMEAEEVLCPYLDVPIQHVNRDILRAMRRPSGDESMYQLIERIRRRSRRIALRTTLLVGFPGETEDRFRELCRFVKEVRFERLGIFPFSPEKGAHAVRIKSAVPPRVANRRVRELMEIQAEIGRELNQGLIGTTLPVLVEGLCQDTDLLLTGRIAAMAPDVDGQVLINEGSGMVGEMVPVRITEAHPYDLVGRIVKGGRDENHHGTAS
jgi:ribosomal protein S12 methylthiotransferase